MDEITVDELKKLQSTGKRGNKYNAQKVTIDNITFASKAEAAHYKLLMIRLRAGEIRLLTTQPKFVLQEAFKTADGKRIREISYVADFCYIENEKVVVVDVKGIRTEVYNIKKKLFMYRYPDYIFIEVS